jgi:signal transduction histidine kinase
MLCAPLKVWLQRFATSVGSVFGDRTTGPEDTRDAIAALVDALRPLDRESADLLHAASHELRTPLTSIVGFTELLGEGAAGPVTAQQRRMLAVIADNAARLMAMVDRLEPVLHDPHDARRPIDGYGAVRLPLPSPTAQEEAARGTRW